MVPAKGLDQEGGSAQRGDQFQRREEKHMPHKRHERNKNYRAEDESDSDSKSGHVLVLTARPPRDNGKKTTMSSLLDRPLAKPSV